MRAAAIVLGSGLLAACGATHPTTTGPPSPADTATAAAPFENPGGMWVPRQLATDAHAKTLKALGLTLDPAALARPTGHPLGAVVYLGGCSASFVSEQGLIATNHHCVQGALSRHSTPDRDLLEDGFLARTQADELWNGPADKVFVTRAQSDVTEQVLAGLEAIADPQARHAELEARQKALVAACEKDRPTLRCQVSGFYGGAEWLLIERLQIDDVRLVYAPPRPVGRYGGEVDNWQWPRHTGDFSFFRAYVGPDQQPAPHAAENVPYRPKQWLKLATKPLEAGDLVMVAGFPGRTNRLETSAAVRRTVEWRYPNWIEMSQDYIATIERVGASDKAAAQKGSPLQRGFENRLKYARGALEGLTKGGAAANKAAEERALAAFIAADPQRATRWDGVLDRMNAVEAEVDRHVARDAAIRELEYFPRLLAAAIKIVRMAQERGKADAARDPAYQARNWPRLQGQQKALESRYARGLDVELVTLAILRAARLPEGQRPAFVARLGGADAAKVGEAVSKIYAATTLEPLDKRLELLESATPEQLAAAKDPLLALAREVVPALLEAKARDEAYAGHMVILRPAYLAALRAKSQGVEVAPDANRTLRVTYGTVRGYRPAPDQPISAAFTTLPEVAAKAGAKPFDAPESLLAAIASGDAGPYRSERLGAVPVCYVTDLDITGGNSGSATLDARGEFVGLAFDGNYESMASDWLFMPAITRSIHVDVRYMLWYLDRVAGAAALLRELGVEPTFVK